MLYGDADGYPEQHDNVVDVVMVQSGEGPRVSWCLREDILRMCC